MILTDTEEKILICLSGAPSNAKVIRAGAQIARAFKGNLSALFVEPAVFQKRKFRERGQLNDNIRLAECLGANVVTLFGEDAATQIAEYARISGTTKIVMGKSPSRRGIIISDDLMKCLAKLAPDIDIFIIPDETVSRGKRSLSANFRKKLIFTDIVKMLAILSLCTAAGALFVRLGFSTANVILAYTIGVLGVAVFTEGRGCSMVSSILSVLIFNFFFVEPFFSLRAGSNEIATFVGMFITAFFISSLTTRIKNQAINSAQSAYRTEILLESSQKLQKAEDETTILTLTANQLSKLLERSVTIYPANNGKINKTVFCRSNVFTETDSADEEELFREAENELDHGRNYSDEQQEKGILIHQIKGTENNLLAVMCAGNKADLPPEPFERSLLAAILNECGIILENERIKKAKRESDEQIRYEELRSNLLNSISHDLRTPLTGISGNAALLLGDNRISEKNKQEIYSQIFNDSKWLIHLVENLLSMTRINGGKMMVKKQPELVSEIFEEAVSHADPEIKHHYVRTKMTDEFIMAYMDPQLIVQVMINLINNAVKYTQRDSEIVLSAETSNDRVRITVSDNGPGITPEIKDKIFDLFYTEDNSRGDRRRGMGLGLALCKSIVSAHGGTLQVNQNTPHGAVFSFDLPKVEVELDEQS